MWYVYNSTWMSGPLTVNATYGNPVTVTEDGNFTSYWLVSEELISGNAYTINATDENGLWAKAVITIVSEQANRLSTIVRGNNARASSNLILTRLPNRARVQYASIIAKTSIYSMIVCV